MTKLRAFTVLWVLCLVCASCRGNVRVPATIQPPIGVPEQALTPGGSTLTPPAGQPGLAATVLAKTAAAMVYPNPVEQVDIPQGRLELAVPGATIAALKLHGGRLWGLTEGGLALWDLDGGAADRYSPLNGIDLPPVESVVSPTGEWWYLDDDGVLVRMAALGQAKQRIVAFPANVRALGPLAVDLGRRVLALVGDNSPEMKPGWMAYDTVSRKLSPVEHLDQPFADSTGLAQGPDGSLWALVYDRSAGRQTLVHYDPAANTFQQVPLSPDIKSWASSLAVGRDGRVWVGTRMSALTGSSPASGLYRYDPGSGWQNLTPADWPAGLDVYAAASAPDGSLWFGTRDGARRYDPAGDRWEHLDAKSDLAAGQVNALLVDPQGSLWFGTSQGARRYDPTTGQWTRYGLTGIDLQDFALFPATEGKLWLFGSQGDIRRLDPASGQMLALDDAWAKANPSSHVVDVMDEPGGASSWAFWNAAGTPGQPEDTLIHRFNPATQRWDTVESLPDLEGVRPVLFASDPGGMIGGNAANKAGQAVWMLAEQVKDGRHVYQLWRTRPSGNSWYSVDLQRYLDGTSPVLDMVSGDQGSLWFSRADGLHHFDPEQNTWSFQDVKAMLGLPAVGRLKSTPTGEVWMRTASGLAYYNPVSGLWRQYLISPEILPGDWDFLPRSDGSIWINHYPSGSLFKFTPGSAVTGLSGTPTPTPLLLWTPTPGITPSPTPTLPPQGWFGCLGSLPTRLYVGLTAKVVKQEFMVLKLRSTPAIKPNDSNLVDLLTGGTRFKIIGGPVCYTPPGGGAFIFWEIKLMDKDVEGWVVESIGPSYVIER